MTNLKAEIKNNKLENQITISIRMVITNKEQLMKNKQYQNGMKINKKDKKILRTRQTSNWV